VHGLDRPVMGVPCMRRGQGWTWSGESVHGMGRGHGTGVQSRLLVFKELGFKEKVTGVQGLVLERNC